MVGVPVVPGAGALANEGGAVDPDEAAGFGFPNKPPPNGLAADEAGALLAGLAAPKRDGVVEGVAAGAEDAPKMEVVPAGAPAAGGVGVPNEGAGAVGVELVAAPNRDVAEGAPAPVAVGVVAGVEDKLKTKLLSHT